MGTHDCALNGPSWGWKAPAATTTALAAKEFDEQSEVTKRKTLAYGYPTPTAKQIVMQMDAVISDHIDTYDWPAWATVMAPFWASEFVYDSTVGTGTWYQLRDLSPRLYCNA